MDQYGQNINMHIVQSHIFIKIYCTVVWSGSNYFTLLQTHYTHLTLWLKKGHEIYTLWTNMVRLLICTLVQSHIFIKIYCTVVWSWSKYFTLFQTHYTHLTLGRKRYMRSIHYGIIWSKYKYVHCTISHLY